MELLQQQPALMVTAPGEPPHPRFIPLPLIPASPGLRGALWSCSDFYPASSSPAVVPWWKEPVQVRLHSNDEGNLPGNASCVVNSAVTLPLPTNTENISNRFAFLLWVMGDLTPYQILPLEIRFYSHTQEKIKKENVSKGPFIKDLFAAWKTYP